MSYVVPTDAYWNPGPVAYPAEPHEPVPGWGMRPNMTGPRLVGVGGLGAAPTGTPDTPVKLWTDDYDAVVQNLVPYPAHVPWRFSRMTTAAALRKLIESKQTGFDYPAMLASCSAAVNNEYNWSNSTPGARAKFAAEYAAKLGDWLIRLVQSWQALEKQYAAEPAYAALFAYAQALYHLEMARQGSALDGNAAILAIGRGDKYMSAFDKKPGRVLSHSATATIQGKPKTSWTASIKPKASQEPTPPADVQQEDQGNMVLWIMIGVVAVGGVAAYALTRE